MFGIICEKGFSVIINKVWNLYWLINILQDLVKAKATFFYAVHPIQGSKAAQGSGLLNEIAREGGKTCRVDISWPWTWRDQDCSFHGSILLAVSSAK